ncbi:pseudouridylate synthase [Moniliophthora roreri MCA 2997]|uniref:tRNA pseudouridine synthase 1 n=2 Tax=Moniliophthora roreri TaxID=221103 RepID=V2XVM7_MONRO|nr:pseudouridylate synthase [Moniliophthora roreri MCA 2997]
MADNSLGEKRGLETSSSPKPPSKRVKSTAEESMPDGSTSSDKPEADAEMTESNLSKPENGHEETAKEKGKGKAKGREKMKRDARKRQEERPPRDPDEPREPRLPKRQTAILMGFCGSSYHGMQYQNIKSMQGLPEQRTIEGELFKALVTAGAVSKDNADDPVKVSFARAARTDAGVHAVGNVVSMKMITEVPGIDNMLDRLNELLPPEIRVWDLQRVQNSFNARSQCDGRKYTYFFPSYLLIPPKPSSALDRAFKDYATSISREVTYTSDPFWNVPNAETSAADEDFTRKRAWRATPAHVERLREIVKRFERTHNFHNFTVAQDQKDKSNLRFMKKIEVDEPAVYGETEWIAVHLDGQSFMLHQRKMTFALVMICRTGTPSSVIDRLYELTRVHIPKMPALGLLLEYPIFDVYNKKIAAANEKLDDDPSDPNFRLPLNFDKYSEQMKDFRQKFIYDRMRSIEDRKGLYDAWVRSVDAYGGPDLLYLNPEGMIPDVSKIERGEKRSKPFRESRVFNRTTFAADDNQKLTAEEVDVVEDEKLLSKKEMQEAEG